MPKQTKSWQHQYPQGNMYDAERWPRLIEDIRGLDPQQAAARVQEEIEKVEADLTTGPERVNVRRSGGRAYLSKLQEMKENLEKGESPSPDKP